MADLRKLKQDAISAAGKGNWRKAAWCYANLEKDEPSEPSWALKLGESQRKLGNQGEAIKSFVRAANAYAKNDLLLKAIAVCKIILGIDPKHTRTQDMLAALYATQRRPGEPGVPLPNRPPPRSIPVVPPTGAAPDPVQSPAVPPVTLAPPPDQPFASVSTTNAAPPLSRIRLSALVPGASPSRKVPATGASGAMEIPVDDDFNQAALGALATTSPHKSAGRNTMATFVLPKTPFFTVLGRDLFRMAVERVRLIQLDAGQTLFSQGDPGDSLYVVAWGEIAVLAPHEVARLREGEFFGEIALLADRSRTATARATVDSQVLAIDRHLLHDLISASPDLLKVLLRFLRERLIANLAETSPLFSPFTPLERLGLAARFQFLEVDPGLRLIEQGQKSPGLFVMLAGEAEAAADGTAIARLSTGAVFGEISLITGQPANASVVALSKSFVLFLPRADFSEVIMTHPQVLEHISALAESRQRDIGQVEML